MTSSGGLFWAQDNDSVSDSAEPHTRLRISTRKLQRYMGITSARRLPRHQHLHWRGLWFKAAGTAYGRYWHDASLLPEPQSAGPSGDATLDSQAVLCHCKPIEDSRAKAGSESRFPDIPDRLDIYLLLRGQFNAFAFSGATVAATIRRTERAIPYIQKLCDWESDRDGGRYRRCRAASQLQRRLGRSPDRYEVELAHAKSALKLLGFQLPGRPRLRAVAWQEQLNKLGLDVEIDTGVGRRVCNWIANSMHQAYLDAQSR